MTRTKFDKRFFDSTRGRLVTLKKHTRGPNKTMGKDRTNRNGNLYLQVELSDRSGKIKYGIFAWLLGLPLPIILIALFAFVLPRARRQAQVKARERELHDRRRPR